MFGIVFCLLFGLISVCAHPTERCGVNFRFGNYYGSSMVLQRAPASAVIWGYAFNVGDAITVTLDLGSENRTYAANAVDGAEGSPIWMVAMDPVSAGGPYTVFVESQGCVLSLENVLFGDVWMCSGQSNMVHRMDQLDDPDDDIADSVNYPNVRTAYTALTTSATPAEDAIMSRNWAVPDPSHIAGFSAVCWLFGKRLNEQQQIPIGLVLSSWGGTRIEAWSSPEALSICFPDGVPPGSGANAASVLYNAMIHPFQVMPIYGAIWYQGEQNQNNYLDYPCAQREMVEDWRQSWFSKTGSTDAQFPFGVVQLAPNVEGSTSFGFPRVRWAQTGGEGYLPTDYFQRFFMAVAIDLPDFDGPHGTIHPRYKRQIADRLALAALPVAYNQNLTLRYQGPLPTSFVRNANVVTITYDSGAAVLEGRDITTANMFEVCCSDDVLITCAETSGSWTNAPILSVSGSTVDVNVACTQPFVTGIRYAWRESPCPTLEACAVYSTDNVPIALPGPPFTYDGEI